MDKVKCRFLSLSLLFCPHPPSPAVLNGWVAALYRCANFWSVQTFPCTVCPARHGKCAGSLRADQLYVLLGIFSAILSYRQAGDDKWMFCLRIRCLVLRAFLKSLCLVQSLLLLCSRLYDLNFEGLLTIPQSTS